MWSKSSQNNTSAESHDKYKCNGKKVPELRQIFTALNLLQIQEYFSASIYSSSLFPIDTEIFHYLEQTTHEIYTSHRQRILQPVEANSVARVPRKQQTSRSTCSKKAESHAVPNPQRRLPSQRKIT